MEPEKKKLKIGHTEADAAEASEASNAWTGDLWMSANLPQIKKHPLLQFLIQNFKEDIHACLSRCFADHDRKITSNHKEVLQGLPGKFVVQPFEGRIIARVTREAKDAPISVLFNERFFQAFERYLSSLGIDEIEDEAEIDRKNLHEDETVIKFLSVGKEAFLHELGHLKYHFDGVMDKNEGKRDLESKKLTPEQLRHEAGHALDAQIRSKPEAVEGPDARILGATVDTWDNDFSPFNIRFEYLTEDPESCETEEQIFCDTEETAPPSIEAILKHMDYFGSGKLKVPCHSERPGDWNFNPPPDPSPHGGGGSGGDRDPVDGDSGDGPGRGGNSGGPRTHWQESIKRILPSVVISARKVQHNSTDNQVQTSCKGESDNLVIVPIPTMVRKKNRKLKTGGRPSYDARYRDKDGSYRALLCEFSFTLCTSDGTAKTTFMYGEDVCVGLDVQNPSTGEVLLGMRPKADCGDKGSKSFFGDTGVRVEIDELEQARIARLRDMYALSLGAGKSYTFFRTLVNGDGTGDREGNDMYRVHFPLKPGTYTARLWIADRKTCQTASFDILN